jgi:AcrR family transcriptional regulator
VCIEKTIRPTVGLSRGRAEIKQSGQSTRDQIVTVARQLFAKDGYAGTSTEQVLQQTGISRGALYHHFKNKESLFEAVLEDLEGELAGAAAKAAAGAPNPAAALRTGCASFLMEAAKPEVRQIVLVDAQSVVGWRKWREIEERYGLGLLKQGLKAVAAGRDTPEREVELYAHILLAALIEVAFLSSRSPNPTEAAGHALRSIDSLLSIWARHDSARDRSQVQSADAP